MDPQLSGFALGLLFGAAKVGLIGTVAFGIAWWRAHRRLARLEATLPEPGLLEERLASLEQAADYQASQLNRLVEGQASLLRQLTSGVPRVAIDRDPSDCTNSEVPTPH
jgi:hypothetical protein